MRTAQRFENAGMPVRRPAGHIRSAVVAFSDEIEMWLKSSRMGRAAVARVERGIRIRAEMAALKKRMAECRERSNDIRLRAIAIRDRQRVTAAPRSAQA